MKTNFIQKSAVVAVSIIAVVAGLVYIDWLRPQGQCEYVCSGRPDYSMCEDCKSSKDHGSKPKELYEQNANAVCRASYNVYEKKYPQGYMVYRCPHNSGYHLTTLLFPSNIPIKKGAILDTNGREINRIICR